MVCSHGVPPCSSALLCVLLLVFIVTMTTGHIRTNEEPCLRQGGICVEKSSCPLEKMVNETGMCPEQEQIGAVCCHGVHIRPNEEPCLRHGGMCVKKSSCPLEKMVNETGMCPEQEDIGAVCCHGVPNTETACHQYGGNCGKEEACKNVKNFGQLDCEEGLQCCLLIY